MTMPRSEIEIELKNLGCPYPPTDDRGLIWLEGYRAGMKSGFEDAAKALREVYSS